MPRGPAIAAVLLLASCPREGLRSPLPHVYWVSRHGDDANPGTRERPWATLQHANDALPRPAPGYCVTVGDGSGYPAGLSGGAIPLAV